MSTRIVFILLAAASVMLFATSAIAVPVDVAFDDATTCDPLGSGQDVHELGIGAASGLPFFPPNEEISAVATFISQPACPASDNSAVPNALVAMTNLSGIDWRDVWYVADPGAVATTISNVDGTVNAGQAFLIDSIGANKPLISESIALNGIFEAGETWNFIIDDYFNAAGGSAADFFSAGRVGFPSTGDPFLSTGSIIAVRIPEPTTCLLLLIGLGAIASGSRQA